MKKIMKNFRALFFVFFFSLLPPVGIYFPLGMAPMLAVTGIAAVLLASRQCWEFLQQQRIFFAMLIVLGVWATLTFQWSILPGHSAFEGLRFVTLSLTGFLTVAGLCSLTPEDHGKIARGMAIMVIVAVIFFLIDLNLGFAIMRLVTGQGPESVIPLEHFDRGTTVLVMLFWPMAFVLWRTGQRRLLAMMSVAELVALIVIPSSTNRLAAVVGLLVWAAAYWRTRLIAAVMAIGIALIALSGPYMVTRALPTNEVAVTLHHAAPWLKFSALHRLLIWRFASERITDRPWFGWGMDASRELPGNHTKLVETLSEPIIPANSEALQLHPHNAFLQWRVELGVPGLLICIGIVVLVLLRCGKGAPAVSATRLACAASALTIGFLGYGAWQAWWLSTIWLATALLVPLQSEVSSSQPLEHP
jgi:O-antigen ligase